MDGNLPDVVADFWKFVWPSMIRLSLLLGLLFYLAPRTLGAFRLRLEKSSAEGLLAALHSKTAEAIGLNKLAPFLTLFAMLIVMVVINDTVRWVGQLLPPDLFFTSPTDLVATGRAEEILAIWQHFPNVRNIHELDAVIENLYDEHADGSGFAFWQDRVELSDQLFYHSKFYILWALVCAWIGLRAGSRGTLVKRLFVVILGLTTAATVSGAYMVHSYRHRSESEIIVARQWLARSETEVISAEELDGRRRLLAEAQQRMDGGWWQLGLPSWTW